MNTRTRRHVTSRYSLFPGRGVTKSAPFPISTCVPQIASHSIKLLTHAGAWDYGIADNLCSADILALGGHAVTTYYASFSAKYRSTVCF